MSDYEHITLLRQIAENTGGGAVPGVEYEEVELYELICTNLGGTVEPGDDYRLVRVLRGIRDATEQA